MSQKEKLLRAIENAKQNVNMFQRAASDNARNAQRVAVLYREVK